jgi:hypothetical protein
MIFLTEFKDAPQGGLIAQGFYDLIPVILFMLGSVILLRTLYSKMVKGCYCLLAAGSIMVFCAGVLKAFHKIIMGIFRVDYIILDKQFTPTQSIGFVFLFLALLGMFTAHNTKHVTPTRMSAITLPIFTFLLAEEVKLGDSGLPAFTNVWPFLSVMIIGAGGYLVMLCIISFKMKRKLEAVLFIISIVLMVGMGYLSTKRGFEGAWAQISCNVLYQGTFFVACLLLKKHGLEEAKLFKD